MKLPPFFELLLGVASVAYASVMFWAAVFRPRLLAHPLLRPRWISGQGARAGRIGAAFGAIVWFCVGGWLAWLSLHSA